MVRSLNYERLFLNLNMDFGEVYRENQNFFNLGNKGFRPQEPKISTSTYLLNSSTYFSLPPEVKEVCIRAGPISSITNFLTWSFTFGH